MKVAAEHCNTLDSPNYSLWGLDTELLISRRKERSPAYKALGDDDTSGGSCEANRPATLDADVMRLL